MYSGLAYWVGGLGLGLGRHVSRMNAEDGDGLVHSHAVVGMDGLAFGWDLRRILFWVMVLTLLCVIAILSTPSETSFKSYLTELSFRRHLRDLHHPFQCSSRSSPLSDGTANNSTSGTSGGSMTTSTTPFRFSNHVAITLRTPGYHFRNLLFFSLVVIFPRGEEGRPINGTMTGPGLGSGSGTSGSAISGKGNHARSIPSNGSSNNLHGQNGNGNGNGHTLNGTSSSPLPSDILHLDGLEDPTISGVWYLGAFGRWFSMGKVLPRQLAVLQDQSLMGFGGSGGVGANRGKKESKGKKEKDGGSGSGRRGGSGEEGLVMGSGSVVGRWAGLLNVVALPDAKEDSVLENVTKLSDDMEQARSSLKLLAPHDKPESTPPLGPNATLPLHTRSPNHKSLLSLPATTPHMHHDSIPTSESHTLPNKTKDSTPPAIEHLQSALSATQAQITDLREQLGVYNSSVSNSHAQLHLVVEDLRRKKKEEDAERADLKHRMKSLEDNKRQAEGQRREAEKKLRAAEGARDEIQGHIDGMQEEVEKMREEVEECGNAIRGMRVKRDSHDKETRDAVEEKTLELQGLDLEVAQQMDLNAELSAKVVQAVELLQSLIEQSPQPGDLAHQSDGNQYHPMQYNHNHNQSGRNSPDGGVGAYSDPQAHHPDQRDFGNTYNTYEPGLHTRQMYPGIGVQQDSQRGNIFYPAPSRQSSGPEVILGREVYSGEQHNSHQGQFNGFDGLGPLRPPGCAGPFGEMEEPTSPSVSLSASFTASLLPQGLFRSLEGDMTPVDSQAGSDEDPMDSLVFHDASPHPAGGLELENVSDHKVEEDVWKSHTPKTTSPLLRSAAPSSSNGSSEPKRGDTAHSTHHGSGDSLHDAVSRKLMETSGHVAPRRWFSSSRLKSSDTVTAEEAPRSSNDLLRGEPLVATTSNESLTLAGTGYSNPFAPSAAEKKALRWGPLNKWGGIRQPDDFPPVHLRSATGTYLGGTASARSSSADLTARSAWDHAAAGDSDADKFTSAAGIDELSTSEEKRHFRFFSMGRKSAKETSPGNGMWKS